MSPPRDPPGLPGTGAALTLQGVVKCYGRTRALDGLDLTVPAGSIFGLVGANGAGKTTLLALCAGLLRSQGGRLDVLGAGPFHPARHAGRVTLLPQDSQLPLHARVGELLRFYGRLQGVPPADLAPQVAALLEWVHLADRARAPVRSLSHGMRKRVMLAQCFLGAPELVLLDEPLSGLDPREVARAREFILARRGRQTIVISSHNLHELELLCDRVAFIEKGRTVREDTLAALTGRTAVLAYQLDGSVAPPLEDLGRLVPAGAFDWDPAARRLTCRYRGELGAAEINRRVLSALLTTGAGILAVQQGERLESEYLRQSQ